MSYSIRVKVEGHKLVITSAMCQAECLDALEHLEGRIHRAKLAHHRFDIAELAVETVNEIYTWGLDQVTIKVVN